MSSAFAERRRRALIGAVATALLLFAGLAAHADAPPGDAPVPAARGDGPPEVAAPDRPPARTIRIEGNEAFGDGELRDAAADALRRLDGKGLRPADADDAAFQMGLAYRERGFAFAAVDYRFEPGSDGPVAVFAVTEGPRVRLASVDLVGNDAFPDEELRRFFPEEGAPFVESRIRDGASSLRNFYYQSGYGDAQVQPPEIAFSEDRTRASVTVRLWEGVRHVLRQVRFRGDVLPAAEPGLAQVRDELVGRPYFARRKLTLRSRVSEIYGNLGYPEVRVEVTEHLSAEDGRVELDAAITSGPRVTIGAVRVEGNEKTRSAFVRSRLNLHAGDLYRLDARRESFQALYRTGLFSKVDLALDGPAEGGGEVLKVSVAEAPSQEVYLEPGWGSYERLRLLAGYRERNLLGTGRAIGVEGKASLVALGLGVTLTDPWFLGSEVTADLPVTYRRRQEPSFTREEVSFGFNLSRGFGEHLTVTAGYGYRTTALTDVAVDADADALDTGYNLSSVKIQGTFDTRDDLFFPHRGQRTFLSAERADSYLGGDVTFSRFTGGVRYFVSLADATILGLRYASGLVIPGAQELTVPLGERFFNGGENTVRSFYESQLGPTDASGDPTGGLAYNVVSVELRQRLVGNLAGSVFVDYGNVAPNRSRSEQGKPAYESRSQVLHDTYRDYFRGFRPGVGFGLQYLLPVGPARLDLAFNPDADVNRGERRFAWHFSVGMAF